MNLLKRLYRRQIAAAVALLVSVAFVLVPMSSCADGTRSDVLVIRRAITHYADSEEMFESRKATLGCEECWNIEWPDMNGVVRNYLVNPLPAFRVPLREIEAAFLSTSPAGEEPPSYVAYIQLSKDTVEKIHRTEEPVGFIATYYQTKLVGVAPLLPVGDVLLIGDFATRRGAETVFQTLGLNATVVESNRDSIFEYRRRIDERFGGGSSSQ